MRKKKREKKKKRRREGGERRGEVDKARIVSERARQGPPGQQQSLNGRAWAIEDH